MAVKYKVGEDEEIYESNFKWFFNFMKDLMFKRFFGSITVKMENGKIVRIEKNESIKPPENNFKK
jgi:hypothetical protein